VRGVSTPTELRGKERAGRLGRRKIRESVGRLGRKEEMNWVTQERKRNEGWTA
jgi:hypothetical protein